MARAPFQVLVFPYHINQNGNILYAVFKRQPDDGDFWQAIAGGGEDDETPLQAARREAFEEAGIKASNDFLRLDSFSTIPVVGVCGFKWGPDVVVIPQYCFAVCVESDDLDISSEHTEYRWLPYAEAREILYWDNNKNALWELNHRLGHK